MSDLSNITKSCIKRIDDLSKMIVSKPESCDIRVVSHMDDLMVSLKELNHAYHDLLSQIDKSDKFMLELAPESFVKMKTDETQS